jgi:pimeloyl-ACP methyl ester carboxylesterase
MSKAGEIEHQRVDVGGLELHVAMLGPVHGEPLVFMHGFPEFWMEWEPQMQHFAALGYRCIAPDQRGYADSDKPQSVSAYHIDRLADDIAGLCDTLGLSSVNLVAHDWGGLVAWHMLGRHPRRVRSLFVINAPHASEYLAAMRREPAQMLKSWYVMAFQLPWLPEKLFTAGGGAFGMKLAGLDRLLDSELRASYRQAWKKGMRTMINWYRAAVRNASETAARPTARFEQPVFVLWGAEDRFLDSRLADASAALCVDAKVVYLEGVSHWVAQEAPVKLIEHLELFLQRVTSGAASA